MTSISRALLLGALAAPVALAAQQSPSERATFYVLVGGDTIAVEQATRAADSVHGALFDKTRGMRQDYTAFVAPDGGVTRTTMAVYRSATDTAPLVRVILQPRGDSMIVEMSSGQTQRLLSRAGAMTYVNPSPMLLELALVRARKLGGPSAEVPLFHSAGGVTTPLTVTWVGGDSATMTLGGVEFRAAVSPDGRLLGAVVRSQRLRMIRVEGTRAVTIEKPDYSAPADAPYTAEDVIVRTPAGFNLAGTLTLPKVRSAKGVPAIVTITGSGPEERDESLPGVNGYRPFRQIADTLARRGIAVLRLDDRGVGGSDVGPSKDPTSADFADDIRAALAWLRTRPGIDGSRLGLVGHSEGGMIAPMIAATDPALKGIVLLAGPAQTGRQILAYQQRFAVEHMMKIAPEKRDSALAAMQAALDSTAAKNAWIRFFVDYDPLATARRVHTPVLILQGENDRQVTFDQANVLAAAFRAGGNRDVTVRVFPSTNHLFLLDSNGNPSGYAGLPSKTIRPEITGAIADWLSARLR